MMHTKKPRGEGHGKLVYLFHIMGVAPFLLYIALKKPDWSESALVVLAVTALALHLRLLFRSV